MKKLISIAILFVMVALFATTMVNAATTKSELADTVYNMGKPYGLTDGDKVRIERFVTNYVKDDTQADALYQKAVLVKETLDNNNAKNLDDIKALSETAKETIKGIIISAGNIVGVNVTFKNDNVELSKDGKLIEVIGIKDGKLAYTGNSTNVVLVVSSVAVVALAAAIVARKKIANA